MVCTPHRFALSGIAAGSMRGFYNTPQSGGYPTIRLDYTAQPQIKSVYSTNQQEDARYQFQQQTAPLYQAAKGYTEITRLSSGMTYGPSKPLELPTPQKQETPIINVKPEPIRIHQEPKPTYQIKYYEEFNFTPKPKQSKARDELASLIKKELKEDVLYA
ncbi:hypothetical protein KY330_05275 [Candidatus Woesearchaeota archaeon]|nr:hypothetical protein [Candidatus Woesearchaeota archaeon]